MGTANGQTKHVTPLPRYTTDIADVWPVLEMFISGGFGVNVFCGGNWELYEFMWGTSLAEIEASIAPEAI
ncbi:MAG: Phage sandwich domain [Bacilli bacterium]|nr:Phage sandwich domain [Bacilli bacterium]